MNNRTSVISVGAFMCSILTPAVASDEEFYGIIESLPNGSIGTWVVGGRSFEVTAKTKLEEDHGPFAVGSCVDVEIDDGLVDSIETEPARKCGK